MIGFQAYYTCMGMRICQISFLEELPKFCLPIFLAIQTLAHDTLNCMLYMYTVQCMCTCTLYYVHCTMYAVYMYVHCTVCVLIKRQLRFLPEQYYAHLHVINFRMPVTSKWDQVPQSMT